MKKYLTGFKNQVTEAFTIGNRAASGRRLGAAKQILFCGMGGSAISGTILRTLALHYSRLQIEVCRGDAIPAWVSKDTFLIFSSYSGNTREILRMFKAAKPKPGRALVVTSGGALLNGARKKGLPVVQIPSGLPPRMALGYLTFSILPALEKISRFKIPSYDRRELLKTVEKGRTAVSKKLASGLRGRSVHLYGASGLMEPVLVRWRAQLAENSKQLAGHHFLPEMLHNEVEGWKHPAGIIRKSTAVFFLDKTYGAELVRKIRKTGSLMKRRGAKVLFVRSEGRSVLARIFSLICLGDWVSYHLAFANHEDPIRIPAIEVIKAT